MAITKNEIIFAFTEGFFYARTLHYLRILCTHVTSTWKSTFPGDWGLRRQLTCQWQNMY